MLVFEKEYVSSEDNIIVRRESCDGEMEAHRHEFVELVYTVSGCATQWIDDAVYPTRHGDLLFINYGQTHRFVSDGDFHYVNILINPVFISKELVDSGNIYEIFALSLFDDIGATGKFPRQAVSFEGRERERFDALIDAMCWEFGGKRAGYRSALQGYLRVVFTLLLRKLSDRSPREEPIGDLLPDIAAYIDENCYDRISLADIAAKSFYHPSYFGRLLKNYYGKSFTAYIREKRMQKAAQLLEDGAENVETVARLVGYRDRKLFYRHFRETFGVTPSRYRRNKRTK